MKPKDFCRSKMLFYYNNSQKCNVAFFEQKNVSMEVMAGLMVDSWADLEFAYKI